MKMFANAKEILRSTVAPVPWLLSQMASLSFTSHMPWTICWFCFVCGLLSGATLGDALENIPGFKPTLLHTLQPFELSLSPWEGFASFWMGYIMSKGHILVSTIFHHCVAYLISH